MSGDTPWSGGRVAIVHDWFQGYHGAERLVEALVDEVLVDAETVDVLTFHAAHELLPTDLSERIVRESRLGRMPGIRQVGHDPGRWRYLLPYMPRYFRSLPLDGYDLVIASSHACAVQAAPPAGVPYACYCHTPMRYAWLGEIESERADGIRGAALQVAAGPLRRSDARAAARPQLYVANSSAVRERVRRFYGREATVVHPPVDTRGLGPAEKQPSRFLWIGRLVAYKRPDLAVEAFRSIPGARLTMVGIGPLEGRIRESLPANVELLGWTSSTPPPRRPLRPPSTRPRGERGTRTPWLRERASSPRRPSPRACGASSPRSWPSGGEGDSSRTRIGARTGPRGAAPGRRFRSRWSRCARGAPARSRRPAAPRCPPCPPSARRSRPPRQGRRRERC